MRIASPCVGCDLAEICANGLACERFAAFVQCGQIVPDADHVPSRTVYLKLFGTLPAERRALSAEQTRVLRKLRARKRRETPEGRARHAAVVNAWRARNREKVRAAERRYYAENTEKVKAENAAHYARHRERILARRRELYREKRGRGGLFVSGETYNGTPAAADRPPAPC